MSLMLSLRSFASLPWSAIKWVGRAVRDHTGIAELIVVFFIGVATCFLIFKQVRIGEKQNEIGAKQASIAQDQAAISKQLADIENRQANPPISWYFMPRSPTDPSLFRVGVRNYGLRQIDQVILKFTGPTSSRSLDFTSIAPCSYTEFAFNSEPLVSTSMKRELQFKDDSGLYWTLTAVQGLKSHGYHPTMDLKNVQDADDGPEKNGVIAVGGTLDVCG